MYKKKLFLGSLVLGMALIGCKKKEDVEVAPKATDAELVRLLVSDVESNNLSFVNMHNLQVTKYDANFSAAALYASSTRRFAFINHSSNNQVQIFDSGIEDHGDHGHDEGSQMLNTAVPVATPVHFQSSYGYNVIFNDEDGSITVLEDYLIEQGANYTPQKFPVAVKHHGAAVPFQNGNIAVTDKDVNVNGQMIPLPQKVVIVDKDGQLVYSPTLRVAGIHGCASFDAGKRAAFGATSGIMIIGENGDEQLVSNHDTLIKTNKWIGGLESHPKLKFVYGAASGLGLFKIDPLADTITPVLFANNILSYMIDKSCNHLIVILKSGDVYIYDAKTSTLKSQAAGLISAVTNDSEHGKYHPSVEASAKYLYITSPETGEIKYFNISNLTYAGSIQLGGKPTKMVIF